MKIIGIDPGSRIMGYGIIDVVSNKLQHIASGSINVAKGEIPERLRDIFFTVRDLVRKFSPSEAAIEEVFMHKNAQSALKLGQARGAALVALTEPGNVIVAEYSARQVKQAVVGFGAAEKSQVQQMVKLLLKLPNLPKPDEADALAIAICHAHMGKTKEILQTASLGSKNNRRNFYVGTKRNFKM